MAHQNYQGYWLGSSTTYKMALTLTNDSIEKQHRLINMVEEMEPFVADGNDIEFAEMAYQTGLLYDEQGEILLAKTYYQKARNASKYHCDNNYKLLISAFLDSDFTTACEVSDDLVSCQHPTLKKALSIAIHTNIMGNQIQISRKYCIQLLEIDGQNKFIKKILTAIDQGESSAYLKSLFASQ
ncbi:MAG: hypothetical protein JKY54_12870 [Flavobacteriales bacterium]|nr:hypothetical protein [Flavobacteriales bacterium]